MFKSSYYSSYLWVEMVEKKTYLIQAISTISLVIFGVSVRLFVVWKIVSFIYPPILTEWLNPIYNLL